MQTIKLKTNINCSGCVAKATPVLNAMTGVEEWSVNTNNPEKILEVKTDTVTPAQLIDALHAIGFKAEPQSI